MNQVNTLNVFLQSRNPRELHITIQPLSLFEMWKNSMDIQFGNVQQKKLE